MEEYTNTTIDRGVDLPHSERSRPRNMPYKKTGTRTRAMAKPYEAGCLRQHRRVRSTLNCSFPSGSELATFSTFDRAESCMRTQHTFTHYRERKSGRCQTAKIPFELRLFKRITSCNVPPLETSNLSRSLKGHVWHNQDPTCFKAVSSAVLGIILVSWTAKGRTSTNCTGIARKIEGV